MVLFVPAPQNGLYRPSAGILWGSATMFIVRSAPLFLVLAAPLFAAGLAPCTDGAAGEKIIPIRNSQTTYCSSDFGWSDTWFKGFQNVYNQQLDVFSGEDSFNLRWTGMTGSGWLSPSMDAGTTVPNNVGSPWSVFQAIDYITPGDETKTRSIITNPVGLQATIETTLVGNLLTIRFLFQNTNTTGTIDNLVFSDYFNFHPNGSLHNGSTAQGTTAYLATCPANVGPCSGAIYTTGNTSLATFISNGFVYGQRAPDAHAVGYASSVPGGGATLFAEMETGTFNGADGPVGPGDTAGALAYNLGSLAAGQTVDFTFYKGLAEPVLTPEPASWAMMAAGLGLVAALRHRVAK